MVSSNRLRRTEAHCREWSEAGGLDGRIQELQDRLPLDFRNAIEPGALYSYAEALAESEKFICEELPLIRQFRPRIRRALILFRRRLQEAIDAADRLKNECSVAFGPHPNPADDFLTALNHPAEQIDSIIALQKKKMKIRRQLTVLTYVRWKRIEDNAPEKWGHRFELAKSWDLTPTENENNFRRVFLRATQKTILDVIFWDDLHLYADRSLPRAYGFDFERLMTALRLVA